MPLDQVSPTAVGTTDAIIIDEGAAPSHQKSGALSRSVRFGSEPEGSDWQKTMKIFNSIWLPKGKVSRQTARVTPISAKRRIKNDC